MLEDQAMKRIEIERLRQSGRDMEHPRPPRGIAPALSTTTGTRVCERPLRRGSAWSGTLSHPSPASPDREWATPAAASLFVPLLLAVR